MGAMVALQMILPIAYLGIKEFSSALGGLWSVSESKIASYLSNIAYIYKATEGSLDCSCNRKPRNYKFI